VPRAGFFKIHKEKSEMVTKIGKVKLVWWLYGVLAVGIFLSAVSVKPARAEDYDRCTRAECNAAYNAAFANCRARGGDLDNLSWACPNDPTPGNDYAYSYCCIIHGVENCGFGGFCD
jgi:hypothetical protein